MKLLLKAIRTALTDATLNAEVPIADITSSYNAELANYPCIILDIQEGTIAGLTGVGRAKLGIRVFSKKNKQHLWEIYTLIKDLLHNKERNITTSERVIHAIYETDELRDNVFDGTNQVWELRASYEILYSSSSVIATTAAAGKIYADPLNVEAMAEKEIGNFRGTFSLSVEFRDRTVQSGGKRFSNSVGYNTGMAIVKIEEVVFKPSNLKLLWNINYDTEDKLADDLTSAISFGITQNTIPNYLQVLFQIIKTDDGKKLEVEADKGICEDLTLPFSKNELTIHNCTWLCLADPNGKIIKVSIEN
jgi:hypothetical protein